MFQRDKKMIVIDEQFRSCIPTLSKEEFSQLERNVLTDGCRDPLVVWNGTLLDGHNRYEICKEHGIEFQTVSIDLPDRDAAKAWMIRNQFGRRNISAYQRAKLALLLKPLVAGEAKNRELAGKRLDPKVNCTEGQTRDIVGKEAGLSGTTIDRVEYITEHATPEIESALEAGDMTINKAYTATRKHQQQKANDGVSGRIANRVDGKYDVIVMDPPWPMQKIERDCRPNQALLGYPTMSEIELQGIDIPAHDDCHLFVWTTQKFLPMALRLIAYWGFKYVLTFVWHKPGGPQPFGLPQYNCEFAIYARKGSPTFIDTKSFPTCFTASRGLHSEKPSYFYDMIARVTSGRRLDMFNRRKIDGFDGWGKESAA